MMPRLRTGSAVQRGFTLVEAIVTMTILAVLAGMSAASFSWLNQTTRIRSAAFDLVADLDFARSEAIKRNADVAVTPVGGSWSNGWTIAFGGTTLRQRGALGAQVAFVTPEPGALTFNAAGRVAFGNVNPFQICPPSRGTISGRTIRVDASGLSRSTKTLCAVPTGT
jgi:type IV fimbrial biogenesis protein FimT